MKFRTCREAAEELNEEFGVNQSHLKRGCMEGKYPSMKIGNRLLVDVDALRPILERERQDRQGLLSTTAGSATGATCGRSPQGAKEK